MSNKNQPKYRYVVGGTVPITSPLYVKRQADIELYESLLNGEYCYVLNARQTGKSSLRSQVMRRLETEAGFVCAVVDLTDIGKELELEQWYLGIIQKLVRTFRLPVDSQSWWGEHEKLAPLQRFSEFIEDCLLTNISQPIVIFIDEIDSVRGLSFSTDDFFVFLRSCCNQRGDNPQYQRLAFVLLGAAAPWELLKNKHRNPPLNNFREIELGGFQFPEAMVLAGGLVDKVTNTELILAEILKWTGGQPFLTQRVCRMVSVCEDTIPAGQESQWLDDFVYNNLISSWESNDENQHFTTIHKSYLLRYKNDNNNEFRTKRLLELYLRILREEQILVPQEDLDEKELCFELCLSGVVIKKGNKLDLNGKIYPTIFNQAWVEKTLADLRPYAEKLAAWLASNCQDETQLLLSQELEIALNWSANRSLSEQDRQFLDASKEARKRLLIAEVQHQRQEIISKQIEYAYDVGGSLRVDAPT